MPNLTNMVLGQYAFDCKDDVTIREVLMSSLSRIDIGTLQCYFRKQ